MNARLRLKLIRSQNAPQQAPAPAAQQQRPQPQPQPLRLLGEGVDAIIQHTTRPVHPWLRPFISGSNDPLLPNEPTLYQRLQRYHIAATLYPHGGALFEERRGLIGELINQAWREGRYPRLRRGAMLLSVARYSRRANA